MSYSPSGRFVHNEDMLDELAASSPDQFANLEAAKQLSREGWHRRFARLLMLRRRHAPTPDDATTAAGLPRG